MEKKKTPSGRIVFWHDGPYQNIIQRPFASKEFEPTRMSIFKKRNGLIAISCRRMSVALIRRRYQLLLTDFLSLAYHIWNWKKNYVTWPFTLGFFSLAYHIRNWKRKMSLDLNHFRGRKNPTTRRVNDTFAGVSRFQENSFSPHTATDAHDARAKAPPTTIKRT